MLVFAATVIALLVLCPLPETAQDSGPVATPPPAQTLAAEPETQESGPPPPDAASRPATDPGAPALATFYYRSVVEMGKLLTSMAPAEKVFVDGKPIVALNVDTVATFELEPGEHRFRAKRVEDEFTLELAPGRSYYFRVLLVASGLSTYSVLAAACPGVGLVESTSARMKPATRIEDRARHVARATPAAGAGVPREAADALVIFYRPWREGGELLNTSVFVDDVEIADLDNECYLPVRLPAGTHAFRSDEEGDAFSLDLAPGSTSYVRIDLVAGVWKGHGRLLLVDPVQGRAESRTSAMRLAKDIRVPDMVVRDPLPQESAANFEQGGEKATVRVYFPRPEQTVSGRLTGGRTAFVAYDVTVKVDDVSVAELDDRTYVDLLLEPGVHRFAIDRYKSVFELPVHPACRLYFRVELDGSFHPVCEEQGVSETGTKRMQRTAKILAPAMVAPR